MSQETKKIKIKDLVLWTENPRDPLDKNLNLSDQDVVDRATSVEGRNVWSLKNLFKAMGKRFDWSEIPTVVYVEDKAIVYDGNRRVLIGKIIRGLVKVNSNYSFDNFDFPESIPCNVCDLKTALENVDRKHAENGSWKPLERDIFKHKHMGESKSPFLIIEDATKIISSNPSLNQRFVKEEIFDTTNLQKIGFSTDGGKFKSSYQNDNDAKKVLEQVVSLVNDKVITTRENRGNIEQLLDKNLLNKRSKNFRNFSSPGKKVRKTKTTKAKQHNLFGDTLSLESGSVNNLYSDLLRLYKEINKKGRYSDDSPMIIRMALRLITEIAAKEKKEELEDYIENNFTNAKNNLLQNEKTTLSSQNVSKKEDLIKLLQVGAHGYTASNNLAQTIAMSLIVGGILKITHGK